MDSSTSEEGAGFSLKEMIQSHSIAPDLRKRSSTEIPQKHADPALSSGTAPPVAGDAVEGSGAGAAASTPSAPLKAKHPQTAAAPSPEALDNKQQQQQQVIQPSASSSFAAPPKQQQLQQQSGKDNRAASGIKGPVQRVAAPPPPPPDAAALDGEDGACSWSGDQDLPADGLDGFAESARDGRSSRSPTPASASASAHVVAAASVPSANAVVEASADTSEQGDDNTTHRQQQQASHRHARTDSGPAVGALVSIPAVESGSSAAVTPKASAASKSSALATKSTSVAVASGRASKQKAAVPAVPIPLPPDEDAGGPPRLASRTASEAATFSPVEGGGAPSAVATGSIAPAVPSSVAASARPHAFDHQDHHHHLDHHPEGDDDGGAYPVAPTDAELLGPFLYLHGAMTTALGGLCVVGPQPKILAATCLMIGIPFLMLAGGVFPHLSAGLIFIDIILTALTFAFLFKTAFADPGYVPKRTRSSVSEFQPSAEQRVTLYWSSKGTMEVDAVFTGEDVPASPARSRAEMMTALPVKSSSDDDDDDDTDGEEDEAPGGDAAAAAAAQARRRQRADARQKRRQAKAERKQLQLQLQLQQEAENETVASFPVRVRYCDTCHRYRAPRTFHCMVCRTCVEVYDHHCIFTGTCIGARNYASFLGFMFSLQATILFYFISVMAGPVDLSWREDICLNAALDRMGWMPVLIIIVIFLVSFGPTALLILHVYLASVGVTTMEHLREKYLDAPNPFDRGFVRNWLRAFGAPDPACAASKYDRLILEFEREMLKFI